MLSRFFSFQRIILLILLFLSIDVNTLIIYYGNTIVNQVVTSLYLLLLPGVLLFWNINNRESSIWEILSNSLGYSIVLLILLGLSTNWILPLFGISQPLRLYPLLYSLDGLLFVLLLPILLRNKKFPFIKNKFELRKNYVLGIIPFAFPVLSILGALNLNNNHSNVLTMTMLGGIAVYVMVLASLRKKISEHVYIVSLLLIALSLLFMTSLRGWYITGHDIYLEYYVFQLTKLHGFWSMASFSDPYSACLSITILPTIFSALTQINDFYIYKLLYQIIFSFSAVVSYLFLRKFIAPFFSFLGTFIIITLPTFMTDMPMLNRQEIALLFFALMLNTAFNKTMSTKMKWFVFLLFGLGLTLSHYSTTYITLVLFLLSSVCYLFLTVIKRISKINTLLNKIDKKLDIEHNYPNINVIIILLLIVATVIWNSVITNTASGLLQTVNNITKDISTGHINDTKNDPASYSLLNSKSISKKDLLSNYVDLATKETRKYNDDSAFIKKSIYNNFPVTLSSQQELPLTNLGKTLAKFHINVFSLNDTLKQTYAKIIQFFIVIGLLSIFWYKKYINKIKKEYLVLTVIFFVLLVGETVLPGGAIDYGILRLFQQGLILLVIPMLIGAFTFFSIFNKIHKSVKVYLVTGIFVFFFLFLSGFVPVLTGEYYAPLNLANSGFYYDAYYTHPEELASITWLMAHRDWSLPIQSDWFTGKKIHTYGKVYSIDVFLPSTIRRNSYVYLSYANLQTNQIMVYINGAPVYYTFPYSFLDQNKNLIYSNGKTKIYR